MRKALSVARSQSVKDIKRRAKIKKINKLITNIVLILIIVFVLSYLTYNFALKNKFGFHKTYDNILFTSGSFPIKDAIDILGNDKNMILALNVGVSDLNNLSSITPEIVYLQSIFSAEEKNVVFVVNTIDSSRRIISCQSNDGNVYVNKELSKNECEELMKKENNTLFVIDFPNPLVEKSSVELNVAKKYILVKPKNNEDLKKSISLLLNNMFDNLDIVNKKIEKINNSLDQNNFDINKSN